MRRSLAFLCVMTLFCGLALAQSKPQVTVPRFELFGGYAFEHQVGDGEFEGWEASLSGNFNRWFGLKADFSGHYATQEFQAFTLPAPSTAVFPAETFHHSTHNFLFGPELSFRRPRWKVFAHVLAGVAHTRESLTVHNPPAGFTLGSTSSEDNGVAFAVGGGGDWMFNHRIGWRVGQIDYLSSQFEGDDRDNLRVSTGLVFHF
jgi:outer membrane protein with beta-barrel domain